MTKKRQVLISLAAVGVLIMILGLIKYVQIARAISQSASMAPPPEAVTSIIANKQVWRDTITAIGSIEPVQGIILSAEEPGTVKAIHFESGSKVNQGDLLVELDTGVEEGNLKAAEARRILAERNLARMQSLKNTSAISKGELDSALAAMAAAEGEVAALKSVISKKRITAPFSGTAGIRSVNVGQYIESGAQIVPLYSLDSVYIDFWLPQQSLAKVNTGSKINFKVDTYPDQSFEAVITAINPQVDEETRNVRLQASSPNPDEKLHPGMFAEVEVILPGEQEFITIPISSVSFAPYGNSVFIVEKMKNPEGAEYLGVRQQTVEIGPRRGEQVAVLSGINPGEEVVTSGSFKLRPGSAVKINNEFAPGNEKIVNPPNT